MMDRAEFDRVWPLLEPAAQQRFEYKYEHVWALVSNPKTSHRLWTTPNGAFITNVWQYPSGFKVAHGWLAGGKLDELMELMPPILEWAKGWNCDQAQIQGRRGWVRALPGFRELAVIAARDLK